MSRQSRARVDAVVVGGGPAGAAAGRLLAAWGHDVEILTKRDPGQPALVESLPPSCGKVLDAVGVGEAVARAGFPVSTGNTVRWGDASPRVTSFGDGRTGYQVVRRDLDRLLRAEAARAGAVVRRGMAVHEVRTGIPDGPVVVRARDASGGAHTLEARMVLDCSGRAGVVARRHRTRVPAGERTLALVGIWRRTDAWPLPDPSHTYVEAYHDGWAWSVPRSPACRDVTVMVDPGTAPAGGGALADRYLAEIDKTRVLGRVLAGAVLDGRPWARDASQYGTDRFGSDDYLLVGDAACFIDPLSSFGVKKALAAAWLAAIVVHTALAHPARASMAVEFFAAHERRVYDSYRRQAATFCADMSRRHRERFWSDRAGVGDPDDAGDVDPVERLRRDRAVQAAFAALRAAPAVRLRRADGVPTRPVAAVVGREIVARPHLVLDIEGRPSAVRHLRGIDLLELAELADRHPRIPALFEAYQRVHGPVSLPDVLGAVSVLLAKGVIRNDAVVPATERPAAGD